MSSPPTPRPVMSARVTGRPARSRWRTQSKPFSLGCARSPARRSRACRRAIRGAAGCRDRPASRNARPGRRPPRWRAGSRPAGRRWRRRRTRRGARPRIARARSQLPRQSRRRRAASGSRPRSPRPPAPGARPARRASSSTTLGFRPGSSVETTATVRQAVRRDPHRALRRLPRDGDRPVEDGARHGVGNDLHRADHLAGHHRLVGRQGRGGDRLVDRVEAIDRALVDDEHAGRRVANRLERPVKGRSTRDALARQRLGEAARRLVLADVVRIEPRRRRRCRSRPPPAAPRPRR